MILMLFGLQWLKQVKVQAPISEWWKVSISRMLGFDSLEFCHGRVAVNAAVVPWPTVKNDAPKLLPE